MTHPKILVVDDEAGYSSLLCSLLKLEGFDAVSAENGSNALELLNNNNFDLIITDLNMPGMNGLELAAIVNTQHPDITIFLITASPLSSIIEHTANIGISNIFQKPLDLETLLKTIRHVLYPGQNKVSVPA